MLQQIRFFLFPSPLVATLLGFLFAQVLWFSGCAWKGPHPDSRFNEPQPANHVSVMAFNVENLFDSIHDPGHEDFPFLPLATKKKDPQVKAFCETQPKFRQRECFRLDWNESVVQMKLDRVASAILQVRGQGPDLLILEEIENEKILRQLNQDFLQKARYQTLVWKPGRDARGIAVGLLSRFPLADLPRLHPGPEGSRGFLEVPLRLPNGKTLYVFGIHLPSQMHNSSMRAEALKLLIQAIQRLPTQSLWMIGGDWNITGVEDRAQGFLAKKIQPIGQISHLIGCRFCSGTHFYRGIWDFLDILVFSKDLKIDVDSIQTPMQAPGQIQKNGKPKAFQAKSGEGISDHLPIYAEILLN